MTSQKKVAFMLTATMSGGGKTTVTQGLLALLVSRGHTVQSYKLGPDYIDSSHHAKITGRACINLDKFLLSGDGPLRHEFYTYAQDADILVIESVGGLFDDWNSNKESPAEIAKLLGVAVIIVLDCFSSCQTIGLMSNALLSHDKDLLIAGLLLNRVSSLKHAQVISKGITQKEKILGHLFYSKELSIPERHLGLHTAYEQEDFFNIKKLNTLFSQSLDIEALMHYTVDIPLIEKPVRSPKKCRLAVAKNKAFCFYYHSNLEILKDFGAEIVFFDPFSEMLPHNINGLYLGGGYPELSLEQLSSNKNLLDQIKNLIEEGLPVFAECGGFIYLCEEAQDPIEKKVYKLANIFPFHIFFSEKLTLSYTEATLTKDCLIGEKGDRLKGHVFHRTDVKDKNKSKAHMALSDFNNPSIEGYSYKNVFASYVHLHFFSQKKVASSFIQAAIKYTP